jgi:hypothetical protein
MKLALILAVVMTMFVVGAVILVVYCARSHPVLVLAVVASAVWPIAETANQSVNSFGRRRPRGRNSRNFPHDDPWM